MTSQDKRLAVGRDFITLTGLFYQAWSACELAIDMAIGQFLKIEPFQTHVLTSGMEFGRKARLLHELVKRSDHKQQGDIMRALNFLRNNALRNVFAHSYTLTTEETVTFLERPPGGQYKVRKHQFTLETYRVHVKETVQAGSDFEEALGFTRSALTEFAYAAVSAENKANTSP